MSPQLLKNSQYGYKTDVWSLGIIFYELLTGKMPYEAYDPEQLLSKIKSDSIEF
jgi:serine/threonine protein kinase